MNGAKRSQLSYQRATLQKQSGTHYVMDCLHGLSLAEAQMTFHQIQETIQMSCESMKFNQQLDGATSLKANGPFNTKHWGAKLLPINWKYILLLWDVQNNEVHRETPNKAEHIQHQKMIDETTHIQSTLQDISIEDSKLINRDAASLRSMTTTSISTYLFGARMLAESYRCPNPQATNRSVITNYFQPLQCQPTNTYMATTNSHDQQPAI
jgi:hypothetical protein